MGAHVPTVRSRRLRYELRRLREQASLTYDRVAEELGWSASKMYRIENDKVGVIVRDVRRMLNLYGVGEGEQREALLTLARDKGRDEGRDEGWWHRYGDVLPEWFQVYVSLESEADSLWNFESEVVPGLLQTEEYARAIMYVEPQPLSGDEIERAIAARMARQEALTRTEGPVSFWTVLNEAVPRRMVGGDKTMRAQLTHLIEMSRLPNVAVQVLPFSAGAHAGMRNAFTLMRFPESTDRQVVYVETQTGSLYLEKQHEVEEYTLRFDYLRAKALGVEETEESEEWLTQVAKLL